MDKRKEELEPKEKLSAGMEVYEWLQCVVVALVVCILAFVFAGRVIGVDGDSMVPTLLDRDKVIISSLLGEPEQGDIVVLTKRAFSNEPIVKRVIATEHQTVDINFDTGEVWVDGVLLDEPYINAPTHKHYDMTFPATVPEGCIFVMGDNRNKSTDSRESTIGMVDTRCVLGKLCAVIMPFSRFEIVL